MPKPRRPRRPRNPFGKAPAGPPKPIVMVAPKPDIEALKRAYDWMAIDKIASFKLAFEWYSNNLTALLYNDPLSPERQSDYDKANKAKVHGDDAHLGEPERVQAYRTAIRKYEKVWGEMPDPANKGQRIKRDPELPRVDAAMSVVEPSLHVKNVQTVLNYLNDAFKGVHFRPTFSESREFTEGDVVIPVTELELMIPRAPLEVVLIEAPTVAKVLSIVKDEATGEESIDGGKFMEQLPVVLGNVAAWSKVASINVNKPVGKGLKPAKAAKQGKAGAPAAPRGPRVAVKAGQTIRVINLGLVRMSGKRNQAIQAMVDGNTVAQYKTALEALGMKGYCGWAVKTAVDAGAIQLV